MNCCFKSLLTSILISKNEREKKKERQVRGHLITSLLMQGSALNKGPAVNQVCLLWFLVSSSATALTLCQL